MRMKYQVKDGIILANIAFLSLVLLFTTCFRLNGLKLEKCWAKVFQVNNFGYPHSIAASQDLTYVSLGNETSI